MPGKTLAIVVFIAGATGLLTGQPRAPIVQSVDLSVPFAPVSFNQAGHPQIAYELHIANFQQVDVVVTAVRISAPAGTLVEYRDAELQQRLVRPGFRHDHATPQIIGPGMRAVLNVWLAELVPTVTHLVELEVLRPSGAMRVSVAGDVVPVQPIVSLTSGLVLDPPLRRGPWVAIYDPLLKGGHRTAIYTIDGRARIPGRFAIDFIALPQSGALEKDPALRRADGNGFGSDVLAVADGVIAAAVDDMSDKTPQPVAPENASGNYVSLDLGAGRFAFYEHLQHGSIVVTAGQRVTRGQVIAKLGSSGSTSIGPHLHFHGADRNSLLGAEGLPFAFRQIVTLGDFASIQALHGGERWRPAELARSIIVTRPAPNSVITFP